MERNVQEAIAFSGGKEAMKLVKILKDKKPRPILITYLPEGDTQGLKPLFQYFADTEGFKIYFLSGKEDGQLEIWNIEKSLYENAYYAVGYNSNILKLIRQELPFIKVIYHGRKKRDLYDRGLIEDGKDLFRNFKTSPRIVFPLWDES